MIAARQRLFRHRRVAMIVLALVLAMRALIPQGMMATPDAIRGVAVLLCDGTGVAGRIDLPMNESHGSASHAEACPFGVLAQAGSSNTPDVWEIETLRAHPAAESAVQTALILRDVPHQRPPTRAPPVAA